MFTRISIFVTIFFTILAISLRSASAVLDDSEVESVSSSSDNVLAKQWFDKIDISGFGSAGFVKTEKDAKVHTGHFLAREATLFIESQVWNDIYYFLEWQAIRLAAEETKKAGQTAEMYIHFKNILKSFEDDLLSIKIGRMDIPFGEEYLWQDSIDNPLITPTVSWPYGWDEGVLFYGNFRELGWIASIMDGADDRSNDDHIAKAYNAKIYGNFGAVYLSASYMSNGQSNKSALEFAGSHFQSISDSSSITVESTVWELNAKLKFGNHGYLRANYGKASVDDKDSVTGSANDRDFSYFTVEPLYQLSEKIYLIVRYSTIGTGKSDKGYHFDGKPYAGGNVNPKYDAKSLTRSAIGLGYKPNWNTRIKFEYSRDKFETITGSTFLSGNKRGLYGVEVAVKF